jgi:hypothetical protein
MVDLFSPSRTPKWKYHPNAATWGRNSYRGIENLIFAGASILSINYYHFFSQKKDVFKVI